MRHRTGRIAGAQPPGKWRAFCRSRRVSARRRGERHSRPQHDDDSGFTLVEVVLTIVLISVTILPILDSVFTSIKASTRVREIAEVDTVLQNAADRVNRASGLCNYEIYVDAAAQAKGWTANEAQAVYQYYTPGATALVDGTWSAAGAAATNACPSGSRTARLVQMVTITVTSPSGSIQRKIEVVKSDV